MTNLNNHFKRQLDSNNCSLLPQDIKNGVLSDFQMMSHIGIDNDEDQNKFFLIRNNVPEIVHLIFNRTLNDNTARAIAAEVFKNREKTPIGTLLELIQAIDLALKKMVPNNLIPKVAYPQPGARQQLTQYNIPRWVEATRNIYGLMVKGLSQEQAKQSVIGNWERREQMDYEQWIKFYKENGPEKYPKLASDFDNAPLLGGIPVGSLLSALPRAGQGHAPKVSPGLVQHLPHSDVDEVRGKVENQRKKLISRLNAAEKMLSSLDGQLFAGDDQELMLKMLQDLKRRIQIANKLTTKSTLFEDYIYRTANQLQEQGKEKAAGFFYKIAQLPPLDDLDMDTPGLGGDVGLPETPPADSGSAKQETHDLLKEFFDNLTRGVSDKNDEKEEREALKQTAQPSPPVAPPPAPSAVSDNAAQASINVDDTIKLGAGFWNPGIKTAQLPPVPTPQAPPVPVQAPRAPAQAPIEVTQAPAEEIISTDNTDDVIEAALRSVTINDVINRLEMLVSIYNQREISRQLAILDIMMDRIGLASFFPALGEAMSKALEANQYIGNRLEEILGKVKGSVDAPGASEWIEVAQQKTNPETDGVRQRLEKQQQDEERRKEMRKEKEIAKMEGRPEQPVPTGPVSDAADIQRPSRVEKAPKLEVR